MSVTLKKTKLQYQYTKIDLEEHEDSLAGYVVEFNKNVLNYEEPTEEDAQEIQSDATHENKQKEREHIDIVREDNKLKSNNKSKNKKLKDIFKKIAILTHPDKIKKDDTEKEEKEELYKRAASAVEVEDENTLKEIASQLNLNVFESKEEEIKFLLEAIAKMKKRIHQIRNSAAWVWYHAEEKNKENIEKQILARLDINPDPKTKTSL